MRRRRVAFIVFGLLAAVGFVFWLRPVSVFRIFNVAQMYAVGASSHTTTVDGFRIHYYTLGPESGRPVVLVHGLGGRAEDWEKLAPYLRKAGYRVYLPDLPGFGQSERPTNFSYSVTDQAKVVEGFFDAMGLKQADLGGWSMGGWIVQIVAAKHPERVSRLMLFDSAGLYMKPEWDTKLFTPVSPAEIENLDKLLMPHPPHLPDFVSRDILRVSSEHAWVMHRSLDTMLLGRETTDSLLPELKMRVLIVWGELDQITPLSEGEKIHKLIPQSQMDVVAGCGHLAPNECAKAIGPEVVRFLSQPM
ncbi:alpha/beta fold hydrolase [Occallatibacter savannae]|uniref:alpha/beta fold hydrolase n=1 Tax=Occallatibacter savannae TaxID=1002691 RepID=UPI0013A57EA7|nr:alpha/beta hydrolase [Occallatibacter savannae]